MDISSLNSSKAVNTVTVADDWPSQSRKPHLTIRPSSGWQALDLREIWQFRDLLLTLAGRDVKLRYRQTALGAIWVVLGPIFAAGLFSFIFGKVAKLPSEGVPYFLFVYVGQLGWGVFSGTLGKTQGSMVGNAHLVSKIYFPRLILPLSSVFSTLLDFSVTLGVTALLMVISGVRLHFGFLLLPAWLLLLLMAALGIGLITAALTVTYRDVGQLVNPLVQALLFGSPVVYATSAVPEHLRPFYYLNPLASIMQAFRWSLLGTSPPPWGYVVYAAFFVIVLFVAGAFIFTRMERRFADVI